MTLERREGGMARTRQPVGLGLGDKERNWARRMGEATGAGKPVVGKRVGYRRSWRRSSLGNRRAGEGTVGKPVGLSLDVGARIRHKGELGRKAPDDLGTTRGGGGGGMARTRQPCRPRSWRQGAELLDSIRCVGSATAVRSAAVAEPR
jgi:hypothetical protein